MNCGNRDSKCDTAPSCWGEQHREQTESLCPVCLRRLPAYRVCRDDTTCLVKRCSQHGEFRTPVWRGAPAFDQWRRPKIPVQPPAIFTAVDKGCPFDCGLCSEHRQRSCTILIEVTQRCDLNCPVCYAAAPSKGPDLTLNELGAARAITSVARQWAGRESALEVMKSDQECCCREGGNQAGDEAPVAPMSLDAFIQRARSYTFSISAMAFQDAWSVALDRVRDCCIHVMAPDGRLIPFCLYNLTAADGRRLYRR